MSKTCKDCLHCSVDDDEVLCSGMPWHYPFGGSDTVTLDKEACEYFLERETTVFTEITASEEKLAEKLVYAIKQIVTIPSTSIENPGGYEIQTKWYSTIVADEFDSESEAIAATVEELKKEHNKK